MTLPSLTGLSLERLSSFLLVAEAGGHARAAPSDPVRQSQLSRQVSELEAALGQRLFDRTPKGMRLTKGGEALARVVRELGQGLEDVRSAEVGPVHVRLGAGDSVLQWLVLPAMGKLAPALEGVELELTALGSDDVVAGLLSHQLDVGLLREREAAGELQRVPLRPVTYALFGASRKLPLAVPTSERGLMEAVRALGPAALRCETFPQVAQAVRSGRYAGVLPTFARAVLPSAAFQMWGEPVLETVATPLLLAWRKRNAELRPRVKGLVMAMRGVLGERR